jgi:hypothetical protein
VLHCSGSAELLLEAAGGAEENGRHWTFVFEIYYKKLYQKSSEDP